MYTIIIGGGQVGAYLASILLAEKHQIKIIENNKDKFAVLEKSLPAELLILGVDRIRTFSKQPGYIMQM